MRSWRKGLRRGKFAGSRTVHTCGSRDPAGSSDQSDQGRGTYTRRSEQGLPMERLDDDVDRETSNVCET